jgi:hypothetical protein
MTNLLYPTGIIYLNHLKQGQKTSLRFYRYYHLGLNITANFIEYDPYQFSLFINCSIFPRNRDRNKRTR